MERLSTGICHCSRNEDRSYATSRAVPATEQNKKSRFPLQSTAPSGAPPISTRPRTAPVTRSSRNATPSFPRSASATNTGPLVAFPSTVTVHPLGVGRASAGPAAACGVGAVATGNDPDGLAGKPPTDVQAASSSVARVRTRGRTNYRPPKPLLPATNGGSVVDRSVAGRLNSLFGLSFETVTALGGGHYAHRPFAIL